MSQRIRRLRPPQRFRAPQISFVGMRDAFDPSAAGPRIAFNLQNVYPVDSAVGGGLKGRPGFDVFNATQITAGPAVRHIDGFIKNDGTRYTLAFAGSKVYQFNWGAGTLTDITPVGPTIDASSEIYTTFFNDGIIVSDGVNKPWHWDGTTATVLTNAPVTYGQPVVYFAKLFVINSANRVEIMWSEENDPTTGYDQGGFNNAWEIVQVANSPLYALAATEEALYYFRAFGVGAVVGRVTPEFASTGTQEAITSTIGTRSPRSVLVLDRDIWFLDADNRPQVIRVGGGLDTKTPPWQDARETARKSDVGEQDKNVSVFWPWAGLILFGVTPSAGTVKSRILVFDNATRQFIGVWNGFDFESLAVLEDNNGEPVMLHGSSDGYVYQHGVPSGSTWTDGLVAGDAAITHVVDGTAIGYSPRDELHFDRVDISLGNRSSLTAMEFQVRTPYETTELTLPNITSGGAVWDDPGVLWGSALWASGEAEAHVAVGLDNDGRWIRVRLEHSQVDEEFGFLGWTVEGIGKFDPPEAL